MKITLVRERTDPKLPGRDIWPDTDHDTTVNDFLAKGYVKTYDGTWNTDLQLDNARVTVTTVRR